MGAPAHVNALFIHGVGEQGAGFSDQAQKTLGEALWARGLLLAPRSLHWAPLADGKERAYLRQVTARGAAGGPLQRLAIGTLADALYYQGSARLRESIFERLDGVLHGAPTGPVYVFAHSLGGLIFTDYLRARGGLEAPAFLSQIRLVTLGCNIGLFALAGHWRCPGPLQDAGSWRNLFHKRDVLGYPLAGDPQLRHVLDHEVSLGGLFRGWTGLSHVLYWEDKALWRKTIPGLLWPQKR